MLVSAIKQLAGHRAARRSLEDIPPRAVFHARYHSRRFHIDDAGHGDWEGTSTERDPRTIQIRFSCVPGSMVDALHGLRAIERQYGRIRDYRLLRDSEIHSEYQAICWAAFESPSSLLRVPPHGTTLKVGLPPRLGRPEGGPGLDDLRSLLVPENCSKSNPSTSRDESQKPARFVILNIKRAGTAITFRSTVKPPFRSRAMKAAIGHGFLEWGGFASLKPLYESSPFTSPARDLPPLDSKNMRLAVNKWSQILGIADPLFPEMSMRHPPGEAETRQKNPESGWEPLSEPFRIPVMEMDAAEELEMPQSAQAGLKQCLEGLLQRSQLRPVTGSTDDQAKGSLNHEENT